MLWLDLCSGLGGASQPALDRGWRVIRVDIDPRFKPDIVADVRSLPLRPFHIDVLWASTPCTEYAKWGLRCFYPNPPVPDISLEVGVLRAIERLRPDWWIVENVNAARKWLNTLYGPVMWRIPGHAFWSNRLALLPNIDAHKGYYKKIRPEGSSYMTRPGSHQRSEWWHTRGKPYVGTGRNGISAHDAAKIPYEIGEAVCIAVERRLGVYKESKCSG